MATKVWCMNWDYKKVSPSLGSQSSICSKFFLATKNLARSFIYLLPCGVFHLFLWFLVTFISHKDIYGYKEEKRSPVFMALVLKHSLSWDCICITPGWIIYMDIRIDYTMLLIYYLYPTGVILIFVDLFQYLYIYIYYFYWGIVDLQCCVSFNVQQSESVIHIHTSTLF